MPVHKIPGLAVRALAILAGIVVAGFLISSVGPASSQATHPDRTGHHVTSHRACNTGSTNTQTKYGPPGYANVNLTTVDSPSGCSTTWVEIVSSLSSTCCRYSSGHIKNPGSSAVSSCPPIQGCGGDGTVLKDAWQYKNPGTVRCRKLYPIPGSWKDCTDPLAHAIPHMPYRVIPHSHRSPVLATSTRAHSRMLRRNHYR